MTQVLFCLKFKKPSLVPRSVVADLMRSREKEDLRILNSGILSSTASTSFLAWRMIAALLGLSSIGTSSTRMVCRAKSANKTLLATPSSLRSLWCQNSCVIYRPWNILLRPPRRLNRVQVPDTAWKLPSKLAAFEASIVGW